MARKMQYNEDIAWARLHQKTQERNKGKNNPFKFIFLCLGIIAVLVLVGVTAYAPFQQPRLLTLPESVLIRPVRFSPSRLISLPPRWTEMFCV